MTAIKKDAKGKGYFVATKNSFVRFEGNGMSVDMESFLKTEEGQNRFRALTRSAFSSRKLVAGAYRAKK